jgi:NAD-dependent deacetylase
MKHLVVFTGAGISAESGISTFRDSDGLWENYDVNQVAGIDGWRKNKSLVLDFYNQRRKQLKDVKPNLAHTILADLEDHFKITIITQNVDDLHERAGSAQVIHLHGELSKACNEDKDCVIEIEYNDINIGDKAADGSQLRPFIVWFGEAVPMMEKAIEIVRSADMLLVIGSSLQVYPAASLLHHVLEDTPVFFIDPNPPKGLHKTTIIPQNAIEGMIQFRYLLLKGEDFSMIDKTTQNEETDEELLECNKQLKSEPNNPIHWIKKSEILGKLQRYKEAITCQDKAIKLLSE